MARCGFEGDALRAEGAEEAILFTGGGPMVGLVVAEEGVRISVVVVAEVASEAAMFSGEAERGWGGRG